MTKPSMHPIRVASALLVASLFGCAGGIAFLYTLTSEDAGPISLLEYLKVAGTIWIWTLPVSLLFGALTHLALSKLKLWAVTAYTLAGMALGPLALIAWSAVFFHSVSPLNREMIWLGIITGGLTALTFRLLVHRSRESASFPQARTRPY